MTVQITIIGLGQVGCSIGLALGAYKETVKRIGHDKEPGISRAAIKIGAVDSASFNLPASIEQADVVILAIPLNNVRDTLKHIREDLKEGAVVLDTSLAKQQVEEWAQDAILPGRYYIGLAPATNPAYLMETGGGLETAHDDLFKDMAIYLCPSRGIPESAVRLGMDLVRMLGATPIISDAAEVDGLMASMAILPKLLAVSLMNGTANMPGWKDANNLAGRSFGTLVAAAFDRDEADGMLEAVLGNRENIVRVLDGYIASLRALREYIQNEDRTAVGAQVRAAYQDGHAWLAERHLEKYSPSNKKPNTDRVRTSPTLGARVRQLFMGSWELPDSNKNKK